MRLGILSLAVVGLILLLFAAKPSREDFDREMASMLREAISGASYDHGKDVLSNLAAIGCKLRTDDCLKLLKKAYSISSKNYIVLILYEVSGPETSMRCWGLMKQFVCDTSLSIPTSRNALRSFL